jgi:hypothetical protein
MLVCGSVLLGLLAGCGGGSSGSGPTGGNPTPTSNPAPTLVSLNPTSAVAGASDFTLAVTGTNFVSSSVVLWNGSIRATTFVSNVELQAVISAADIANAGSVSVTVFNPAPGGGTSPALAFTIPNPSPTIGSLTPASVVAGGPGSAFSVSGSGFTASSTVLWNNSARQTEFMPDGTLQAFISTSDIATVGSAQVTVSNPSPGGGISNSLLFTIANGGFAVTAVSQVANDLAWDPVNQVIYLSISSTASTNANSIAVLNPTTGTIVSSQPAGSDPNVLAVSGDSSYLYVGLDSQASVRRFVLPSLTPDISYALGANASNAPYSAVDLQVAPSAPHTTAVALGDYGPPPMSGGPLEADGGIKIYDDATPRTVTVPGYNAGGDEFGSLQWGLNANVLYSAAEDNSGDFFYDVTVSSTGVVLNSDNTGTIDNLFRRIHFDAGTKLIYVDDGQVLDPSTGLQAGIFDAAGLMVPDSTLNAAFFLGQTDTYSGTSVWTIESFDLTHFTPVNSITFPNIVGNPLRLIRWGQNGLAFNTDSGGVYLIQGDFVGPVTDAVTSKPGLENVHRTWGVPGKVAHPEERH